MARSSAQSWNKGMVGKPSATDARPVTPVCDTARCGHPEGAVDPADPMVRGWILTRVNGSIESGRWWCSGACAHRGIALAQLRMHT